MTGRGKRGVVEDEYDTKGQSPLEKFDTGVGLLQEKKATAREKGFNILLDGLQHGVLKEELEKSLMTITDAALSAIRRDNSTGAAAVLSAIAVTLGAPNKDFFSSVQEAVMPAIATAVSGAKATVRRRWPGGSGGV